MSVVTIDEYRVYTGDSTTASATVQTRLDMAESILEDELGRVFAHGSYTERLKRWVAGFVYPSAVPVTSVASSASYEIYDNSTLCGAEPDDQPFIGFTDIYGTVLGASIGNDYETYYDYATVSYDGGFTTDTMPTKLKLWISKLAYALDPALDSRPLGAQLVRVGDVQVSYEKTQIEGALDQLVPGISRAVRGYRLRRK